jgi:hypothetical protein
VNSSAADPTFRSFLRRSMQLLRDEQPAAYVAMCRQLAAHGVQLQVGSERVGLRFATVEVSFDDAVQPQICVRTSKAAVVGVLDAEMSLAEAVLNDKLVVIGALPDLVAFEEALSFYVHGAVRAPSFPLLWREYRNAPEGAQGSEGTCG